MNNIREGPKKVAELERERQGHRSLASWPIKWSEEPSWRQAFKSVWVTFNVSYMCKELHCFPCHADYAHFIPRATAFWSSTLNCLVFYC